MTGCNHLSEFGRTCNSTYGTHDVYFRDPNAPSTLEYIQLCKTHYDIIEEELTHRIKEFQMKISNLIAETARERKLAKEAGNEYYYNPGLKLQRIEDLKELIKRIKYEECKNYFCNNSLKSDNRDDKIYSVTTFSNNGKRHHTFYFCSLKCFNIIKGKCGIQTQIHRGQTTF